MRKMILASLKVEACVVFLLTCVVLYAQTLPLDTVTTRANAGTRVTSSGVLVEEHIPSAAGESIYRLLRMPNADGTVGQCIKTDGAGNLSFAACLTAGVSSLAGTANQITASAATGAVTLSLTNPVLTGTTGSIGGGALTASCATGTATIANSTTAMVAVASPTSDISGGTLWDYHARVSTNGTVTVYVCGTGTPTASTYIVRVIP